VEWARPPSALSAYIHSASASSRRDFRFSMIHNPMAEYTEN
jgi:hypothetical protein